MDEILILGATGRAGRAIAAELLRDGHNVVLTGRDGERLSRTTDELANSSRSRPEAVIGADSARVIIERRPTVVVNTIGPFAATATAVVGACMRVGSHYVDLSNELHPVRMLLGRDTEATTFGVCLVTGAGYGVLATEALVQQLCDGHPVAQTVRVAAMPVADGVGPAVLTTAIDVAATGGWAYRGGALTKVRLGSQFERTPLPDGTTIPTVAVPTGELEAAHRASGAGEVVAATSEAPTGSAARLMLPLIGAGLRVGFIRRGLLRLVDRYRLAPPAHPGATSWAYASVTWSDGEIRRGWLHMGEGYAFTAKVAALVAGRLADGLGHPGAFTPGALFGPGLARDAGATLITPNKTKEPT